MLRALHLHSPWFALLAPVLIGVVVLALRRRLPSLVVSSIRVYRAGGATPAWRWIPRLPLLLEALGVMLLLVALVRPQFGIEETIHRSEGIDIILALDISGSMQAVDAGSASQAARSKDRLSIAKEQVARFIEHRPNDRIGLLAFSTRCWTACPPTLDHDFLLGRLAMLDPALLPGESTNIAGPIAAGTRRLKDSPAKRRVMVLFTDGGNNVQDRISPAEAARIAAKFDVIVHTVGIGSGLAWFPARDPFGGTHWMPARDSFDAALMTELADTTKGQYYTAADEAGFEAAMQQIDALEATEMEHTVYLDYQEAYQPWLLAGLGMVLLALILEHTIFLKVP